MKKLFLLLLPLSLLADVLPVIRFDAQPGEWYGARINIYANEEHAGYLEYHLIPETPRIMYIDVFFIKPEFRNKKIGTLLMQEALKQFEAQHCSEVILRASPFGEGPRLNLVALMNFYKKFGFQTFNSELPYDITHGGNMHKVITYQLA